MKRSTTYQLLFQYFSLNSTVGVFEKYVKTVSNCLLVMAYQGKLAKEVLDLSSDGYDKRGKVKEK